MAPLSDLAHEGCENCIDHQSITLLIKQHDKRMGEVEDLAEGTARNSSNIEGRINTFTWVIGLVFFLFCSMAFYGVVQIDKFKTIYMEGAIETSEALNSLASEVEIQSAAVEAVTREVTLLKISNKN